MLDSGFMPPLASAAAATSSLFIVSHQLWRGFVGGEQGGYEEIERGCADEVFFEFGNRAAAQRESRIARGRGSTRMLIVATRRLRIYSARMRGGGRRLLCRGGSSYCLLVRRMFYQ